MDTSILALLLFVSVAGTFAEARSPPFRVRRNGWQENDTPLAAELGGVSRTKRESKNFSTTESTTVPTPTTSPVATAPADPSSRRGTSPKSSIVPDPASSATTPKASSATSSTAESSPTTASSSIPVSSPASRLATPTPRSTTPLDESSEPETPSRPGPEVTGTKTTTISPIAESASPKSDAATPARQISSGSAKSTSPPPVSTEASEARTTTALPVIGSRFNAEDEPRNDAGQRASIGTAMYHGFPSIPFPTFFMPNFVPDFSYPSNPYTDPTFNSIPSAGNGNAWTGGNGGDGLATSFASAAASSDSSNVHASPFVYRGGFAEQPGTPGVVPAAANEPKILYAPDTAQAGGYGYGYGGAAGGEPFFDPSWIAFPGANFEQIQKQMEAHFRQMQAQLQKQQQAIFEASNRIGATDGSSAPGPHTAYSSISLGPGGGYQAGAINPAAPGIESRFGEDLPPPSGNSFGVFSSSSSVSRIGPDGKQISHKSSTTGVNDNGKITFRTVED